MDYLKNLKIIRPDDWHIHLREGELLQCVINSTTRIIGRCIVMPNLSTPITTSSLCKQYKKEIKKLVKVDYFEPHIPCYLTDNIDLNDFDNALQKNIFVGAKLYPANATTNSKYGVTNIEKIFPALELLIKNDKPLLVHGEKIAEGVDLFDREKQFIDDELLRIVLKFPLLKIIFEHVSSKYGADFIVQTKNLAGTITPHHMLLTKKDVFKDTLYGHHFCMPIVKEEEDLLALRKHACSGNDKFFIGTDSAPHEIQHKQDTKYIKPGIFSAPCSIELYAEIFHQENAMHNLEKFTSINGSKFYGLKSNFDKIELIKKEWIVDEHTINNNIKVKNFYGGKKLNWQIRNI